MTSPQKGAGARPNIVFIITDQQRYDTIAALGYDHVDTPNLDRLVREGVSFSQCHVTAPSCAPSRASLFTGYYPHTTGILKNADRWTRSWVERLAGEAGYHCVNIGKMHTWPFTTPCGFHERQVVENKDRYLEGRYFFDEWDKALAARGLVKQQRETYREREDYREALGAFTWELPADMHSDVFVGDRASWWLRHYPRTEPLFLQVGFPGPHPPYDPTPEYLERYAERDVPLDEVSAEDLEGQPEAFKRMREHNCEVDHDSVVHQLEPSEDARLRQRRHYLANVTMIDDEVGKIMAALEETGYLENTVIVFTSDHGDCLTDHGHSQKWTCYEQVTRVPMLVWGAGVQQGREVNDLVSLMDIGPTVLELAGLEPEATMEAESVLGALRGDEGWRGRDCVYAEQARDGNFGYASWMTMARTERWKLVHLLGEEDGQLFDLEGDPGEVRNLWFDEGHAEVKREMVARMLDWRMASGLDTAERGAGSR
ncbi:MAG: sulfatase-like hydrolase/transferase [Verrucomicrobiota bacterium]